MKLIHGFDISSWQGKPSQDWFDQMYSDGFRLFMSQWYGGLPDGSIGHNVNSLTCLERAATSGMKVASYIYARGSYTEALKDIPEGLLFIAIDVEASAYKNVEQNAQEIESTGNKPIVYASRYQWGKLNPILNRQLPLLDASYTHQPGHAEDISTAPDLDWNFIPYGNFSQRAGLQWSGDTPMHGVNVDLGLYDLDQLEDNMDLIKVRAALDTLWEYKNTLSGENQGDKEATVARTKRYAQELRNALHENYGNELDAFVAAKIQEGIDKITQAVIDIKDGTGLQ